MIFADALLAMALTGSPADQGNNGVAMQRNMEIFTGLLVVVGFLQAGVMVLQWCIYRRQAREMRRQRHEMRRQRHVMYRQWKAMCGQLEQMESAGEQTERLIGQSTKSADAAKESADAAKASADTLVWSERAWVQVVI